MPNDLRVRVAATVATLPIGGTDAQIAAALRRYASSLGITLDGTPQQQLEAILAHWLDDVRRVSKRAQSADLRAANEAAIQAAIEAENAL